MKKKTLIELFIYLIAAVVAIALFLSSKPEQKPIQINSDFKVGGQSSRGVEHDFIPMQQSKH
ncbi:MAG: hypothetical protein N2645_15380 [Clostridia bacterium]|nr:hypothetical protein [Clostridia bacterium]